MPGGGAEIFNMSIRNRLCPEKISGEKWLKIMETAHRAGLKTNATMLYGHIESLEEHIEHLDMLRRACNKPDLFLKKDSFFEKTVLSYPVGYVLCLFFPLPCPM